MFNRKDRPYNPYKVPRPYYLGADTGVDTGGAVPDSAQVNTGWSVYGKLFLVSVTAALITEALRRKIWKKK